MKPCYFCLLFLLLVSLSACEKNEMADTERTLYLRHKGADMPIWVRGNLASNKLVLFLHGGPGDCAMCYRHYLKGLEKDVAVAYWDQRIAGSSSGKVDVKTLNYAQFGEDAYYVVKLLKEQYPNTRIYLLAHSFGVELAWQFLTTGDNQKMVSGLMAVNGTFSTFRWLVQMREWILREARLQNRTEIEKYAQENPVTRENLGTYKWPELYKRMLDLGGNPVSIYDDKSFVLNYLFASPNTALAQFSHPEAYTDYGDHEIRTYEKGPLLKNIEIPVALFWGKKDGVVPIEIGYETRDLLSKTVPAFVTFEQSHHEPFITETDRFVAEVLKFVR
ncbi:pimeloyl-ACP methyl ester carboxylesterase [Larkinella arboricola]|uniref:Pimeloyl-ACP methyl ester carboxylesterase n=1 Tax=Larkinella arboricola TaxID=643671 RepID=A0A327X7P2_LARAB|nr:alpha/beta hydrolase [Larkinella arboricola]RAK02679.1 pimeloyl-ACP methyl ester carboxylesterase [Larkinella arboricola]